MRLFVAVGLPASVREGLAEAVDAARGELPPASWVRGDNLHLTLAFLGEVAEERVAGLERGLTEGVAGVVRFAARTGAPGAFPLHGALRVIWIGLEPEPAFAELAAATRRALSATRVEFDDKPFRPHVTLARARRPWASGWRERIEGLAPAGLAFEVRSLRLVESVLGAGGARYRTRAEIGLQEAA